MLEKLNLEIKRSRRKTLSLAIHPDLRVVVSAPLHYPVSKINAILSEKSAWIQKKLNQFQKINKPIARSFREGEHLSHLGTPHVLSIIRTQKAYASRFENRIVVSIPERIPLSSEAVKKVLEKWYREEAFIKLNERVKYFSQILKVNPKSVSVRDYKGRWGTCQITGDLVFNWRIIFAEEAVFNYVVIHELSHLRQFNHSQAFWATVASAMPDYKMAKKRLKEASLHGELDF